jgi:WASH complex subunit 7
MYSARELIPSFFKNAFQNPSSAKRLPFFVQIFEDCEFLKCQTHLLDKNILYDHFKKEVFANFNDNYIIPIIRSIEDFLRVNIHTMLIAKIEGINPYKQQSIEINRLLNINTIEIFD